MSTEELMAAVYALDYKALGRDEWRRRVRELEKAWREWLQCEYLDGQFRLAVADAIFNKAWEDGHASGYQEVEIHYSDLADFARLIVGAQDG